MNRPIMHTASAPPSRAATASAGRFADSPVSFTHSDIPRSPRAHPAPARPIVPIRLLCDRPRRCLRGVRRANIQLEHPQPRPPRQARQIHRPIRPRQHDRGRNELPIPRRRAIDRRNRRKPLARIALRQAGPVEQRHPMRRRHPRRVQLDIIRRSNCAAASAARSPTSQRPGHAARNATETPRLGHHRLARGADHRIAQPRTADGRRQPIAHRRRLPQIAGRLPRF